MKLPYAIIISISIGLLALLAGLYQQGLLNISQESLMQRLSLRRLAFFPPTPTSRPIAKSFSSTTATMSSNSQPTKDDQPLLDSNGQPLGLPQPSQGSDHKLDLSSGQGSISMDHLGPLVVNKDGSLSRISNWEQMTETEQKNTLRILGKRNQLRTEDLKVKEAEQGKVDGS
ncbi:hypothetical protein CLAFUW4_14496 [Fulvia fulva]|uniref:Uncharacterized protein n=1 Tax=Passalora fulva TaxID=5499 RepID=A0A9Q8UWT7_PASFU|nr:uncharacterized protein CLAFUR5_14327 [Fulvia fulva]KAK4608986.1 hypothetical protein CLAFUR4_14491 [Fulvia fulva]KAK4609748.1 hypothetical protein CLAFUR0_14493 [Fulvia fulva]UJO25330.1 hypothetical protein CLAFUR5_14327 [Fulvia fulva]WPV22769.1 hypothetical protein CLAFUW4_14496 [Fulvia fulva]WPV37380.1 hypothetical protein CLAFUW7_14500 [Fulvia fulva]